MPQPGGKVRAAPFGEGEICAVAVSVLNLQSRVTPRESWRRSCAMLKTKLWRWSRYHVIRNHVTCFPTNSDSHVSPQILVMFPSKFWSTCFPLKMCRWTEVQNREQSEVTANGRGWWVDVRVSKSLEPKLSQRRLHFKLTQLLKVPFLWARERDETTWFLPRISQKLLMEAFGWNTFDGTTWWNHLKFRENLKLNWRQPGMKLHKWDRYVQQWSEQDKVLQQRYEPEWARERESQRERR